MKKNIHGYSDVTAITNRFPLSQRVCYTEFDCICKQNKKMKKVNKRDQNLPYIVLCCIRRKTLPGCTTAKRRIPSKRRLWPSILAPVRSNNEMTFCRHNDPVMKTRRPIPGNK